MEQGCGADREGWLGGSRRQAATVEWNWSIDTIVFLEAGPPFHRTAPLLTLVRYKGHHSH